MGNETKINPFARILNAVTKVNPNVASQKEEMASQTVVNSELAQAHEIEAQVQEQLLLGKYSVVKPLDVVSGEADLYLCNYQEKSYVAKIYRRDVAIKSEVMQALKEIQSPYVAHMIDTGMVDGKTVEILPYYKNGSLQGKRLSYQELRETVIPCINLGIYTRGADGTREANVTSDMPYQEMSVRVRDAIENYFKLDLGRPEILNRIGENIVVFDYIRPEVAVRILKSQVDKIIRNLQSEKRIAVSLSDAAYQTLEEKALANLSNGGRGIGNIVENFLINPLARYLFDHEIFGDATLKIDEIQADALPPELKCS